MTTLRCALLGALGLAACTPSEPTELGPHTPTALTETQAHLVIEQRLLRATSVLSKHQGATLEDVGATDVDFVFGEPAWGIEWVSEADRQQAATDGGWPEPSPEGPLRVITGTLDNDEPVRVLVLSEGEYLYERNPRWVQRGAPGIDTLEDRLAQDVDAFLEFLAAEDPPLSVP